MNTIEIGLKIIKKEKTNPVRKTPAKNKSCSIISSFSEYYDNIYKVKSKFLMLYFKLVKC